LWTPAGVALGIHDLASTNPAFRCDGAGLWVPKSSESFDDADAEVSARTRLTRTRRGRGRFGSVSHRQKVRREFPAFGGQRINEGTPAVTALEGFRPIRRFEHVSSAFSSPTGSVRAIR